MQQRLTIEQIVTDARQRMTDYPLILRYLLGDLPEPEQMEFEERFFADSDLFEQIRSVERTLIEDYLRGKLSGSVFEQFERHYQATPDLRAKVELVKRHLGFIPTDLVFVQELIGAIAPATVKTGAVADANDFAPPQPAATSKGWWQNTLTWWSSLSVASRPAAFGMALAIIAFASLSLWLFVGYQGLSQYVQTEKTRLQRQIEDANREAATQRDRAEKLAGRDRIIATRRFIPSDSGFNPLGGGERSNAPSGQPKKGLKLELPRDEGSVELKVELEGSNRPAYRAVLRPVTGRYDIWRQSSLKILQEDSKPIITLNVPVNIFTADVDYNLILTEETNAAEFEIVYQFRVVKR